MYKIDNRHFIWLWLCIISSDCILFRDKVIEQERQLRQAAEDRLQTHLTDLYHNPEVNQELRERLPRASKSDPLHPEPTVNDSADKEKADVVETMEKTTQAAVQK